MGSTAGGVAPSVEYLGSAAADRMSAIARRARVAASSGGRLRTSLISRDVIDMSDLHLGASREVADRRQSFLPVLTAREERNGRPQPCRAAPRRTRIGGP